MDKLRVLFLCTGNSCRSQMAEGWAKKFAGDRIKIKSAGIEAHGKSDRAISAMREIGIDISTQESIRVNGEMLEWTDLLVTLCDNAEERCPIISSYTMKLHLPLSDPAKLTGTEEEIIAEFQQARDQVKRHVQYMLEKIA